MRLAQLDRAFGYGPKGRGFESSNTRFLERSKVLEKSRVFDFFVFGSNPVCLLHFITLNSTHRAWQLQGRQYHQSYQEWYMPRSEPLMRGPSTSEWPWLGCLGIAPRRDVKILCWEHGIISNFTAKDLKTMKDFSIFRELAVSRLREMKLYKGF